MKRCCAIIAFFILCAGCKPQESAITSFDGLNWGTPRSDIIDLRGAPGAESEDQLVYAVEEDFYGFTIDRHYFGLSGECGLAVTQSRAACYLQHGGYRLKTSPSSPAAITEDDYLRLQRQLTFQYGIPEVASETSDRRDTNEHLLAKTRRTTATFNRDDGSYIQLYRFEYDRDHYWNQLPVNNGIQMLTLWFVSADYAKQQRQNQF